MGLKLDNIRKNYQKSKLVEINLPESPIELFELWFQDAINCIENEPNAMVLSTVMNNKPSARVVLLKELFEETFVFFTNNNSRKGIEMEQNPFVALTFFWPFLERQVRIEGEVEETSAEISTSYFNSRPEDSRISAIISSQSQIIPSRESLESRFLEFKKNNQLIQKPIHWGGYCCKPTAIEFWQGGEHRLHDRIKYSKETEGWKIVRLSP